MGASSSVFFALAVLIAAPAAAQAEKLPQDVRSWELWGSPGNGFAPPDLR